jgi:heme exporter protein D
MFLDYLYSYFFYLYKYMNVIVLWIVMQVIDVVMKKNKLLKNEIEKLCSNLQPIK